MNRKRCDIRPVNLPTVVLALFLAVTAGCIGTGDGGGKDVSRTEVMQSLTGLVIVPGYREAAERTEELRVSVESLCDTPNDATLETARQRWRAARSAWVATAALRFGPAMERRSESVVDWWPIDPEKIDGVLDEGDTVSVERVSEFMSSTQRGLGAVEYLLFGDTVTGASSFTPNNSRCQYVAALASTAAAEVEGIRQEWQGSDDRPGHAAYFSGSRSDFP